PHLSPDGGRKGGGDGDDEVPAPTLLSVPCCPAVCGRSAVVRAAGAASKAGGSRAAASRSSSASRLAGGELRPGALRPDPVIHRCRGLRGEVVWRTGQAWSPELQSGGTPASGHAWFGGCQPAESHRRLRWSPRPTMRRRRSCPPILCATASPLHRRHIRWDDEGDSEIGRDKHLWQRHHLVRRLCNTSSGGRLQPLHPSCTA
ncbi:unnamed protein product, partial [Urochloa humidicola]